MMFQHVEDPTLRLVLCIVLTCLLGYSVRELWRATKELFELLEEIRRRRR